MQPNPHVPSIAEDWNAGPGAVAIPAEEATPREAAAYPAELRAFTPAQLAARVAELEQIITDAVSNQLTSADWRRPQAEFEQALADARTSSGNLVREAAAIRARWGVGRGAFEDVEEAPR